MNRPMYKCIIKKLKKTNKKKKKKKKSKEGGREKKKKERKSYFQIYMYNHVTQRREMES